MINLFTGEAGPKSVRASLDPAFQPMSLVAREARAASSDSTLGIAWERSGGGIARLDLPLPTQWHESLLYRWAERAVKTALWSAGGFRLRLAGPQWLCERLQWAYSAKGGRAFDADLMQRVYGQPMTVEKVSPDALPMSAEIHTSAGGHLDGCRLGFDLGASDFKVCALRDGEVLFSEELPWNPRMQPNPDYHYEQLNEGLKKAAASLPRVDAIGGSTAGVVVENRIMVASLFRSVPPERFPAAQQMFERLRRQWDVPVEVANDGDVAALAGAISMHKRALLGIAMGSSEAAGYLDREGRLTGRLSELAFAPVDFNPGAPADEWSGDGGVGALYFSQQAVNKLAGAAGIVFEEALALPERLKVVQRLMDEGDERARRIYQTIGINLGFTAPWYREFYDFDHLLILGRVTSGPGGEVIVETARQILATEFPDSNLEIFMPDEKVRRVGQAVAAASLPRIQ